MIKHVERMRVSWVDTDASGRIHYTAALRYFEVAEHALMRRLLAEHQPAGEAFSLPRVHVEADYQRVLTYPDEFDCAAWIAALGRTSVTYGYDIHRADGVLCIRGKIVAVTCDLSGQAIPIPAGLREALSRAL
jgi:YbgC/YbaW family acyl-CoA thioester hydrolase